LYAEALQSSVILVDACEIQPDRNVCQIPPALSCQLFDSIHYQIELGSGRIIWMCSARPFMSLRPTCDLGLPRPQPSMGDENEFVLVSFFQRGRINGQVLTTANQLTIRTENVERHYTEKRFWLNAAQFS
jgi:hypothetical protein